jgi:hypothetical protein
VKKLTASTPERLQLPAPVRKLHGGAVGARLGRRGKFRPTASAVMQLESKSRSARAVGFLGRELGAWLTRETLPAYDHRREWISHTAAPSRPAASRAGDFERAARDLPSRSRRPTQTLTECAPRSQQCVFVLSRNMRRRSRETGAWWPPSRSRPII